MWTSASSLTKLFSKNKNAAKDGYIEYFKFLEKLSNYLILLKKQSIKRSENKSAESIVCTDNTATECSEN